MNQDLIQAAQKLISVIDDGFFDPDDTNDAASRLIKSLGGDELNVYRDDLAPMHLAGYMVALLIKKLEPAP